MISTKQLFSEITECRVCASPQLAEAMAFGDQYLASTFVEKNEGHPLASLRVPLSVMLCTSCGQVQLKETVDRETLYHEYFYRSGTNPMMRNALQEIVDILSALPQLRPGDAIVDLGCNDGTMLSLYAEKYQRIGVEPATNISWDHLDPSIRIVNGFFTADAVRNVTSEPVRIVTSIAMLYSVENLNAFAAHVKEILAHDGVWCIQVSYLPTTLENLNFFDVFHEHLYYFTLTTLSKLMERHGLRVYDATLNDVNGGSMRAFVTHAENNPAPSASMKRLLERERAERLDEPETYHKFFQKVCTLRDQVNGYLRQEAARGKTVIGLGASTKGNALLQFFGIDKQLMPYISERNPDKVGLRTLGTDIELISEERARELDPGCMLVLIWFFKQELLRREEPYLARGGKLLFPMPYCHVISKNGEQAL